MERAKKNLKQEVLCFLGMSISVKSTMNMSTFTVIINVARKITAQSVLPIQCFANFFQLLHLYSFFKASLLLPGFPTVIEAMYWVSLTFSGMNVLLDHQPFNYWLRVFYVYLYVFQNVFLIKLTLEHFSAHPHSLIFLTHFLLFVSLTFSFFLIMWHTLTLFAPLLYFPFNFLSFIFQFQFSLFFISFSNCHKFISPINYFYF